MRYVFTNLGQGLRRNLTMHLAVVLTLFVSLTLVGIGTMLWQQTERVNDELGNELQVTAYLCRDKDSNPDCVDEVTEPQREAIEAAIEDNPEVASYVFEDQETAFEKTKELYPEEIDRFEGPNAIVRPQDLRASYRITLKDPRESEGILSAVRGLDGVASIQDQRELIGKITGVVDFLRLVSAVVALVLGISALLLVANTVRLAAFARRKEIRIMRLVGAGTLYIALPFLLEALVTALLGVALAGGALVATQYFFVEGWLFQFGGFPWVGWDELLLAIGVVGVTGPVVTLLPTLLLTGKYVKV